MYDDNFFFVLNRRKHRSDSGSLTNAVCEIVTKWRPYISIISQNRTKTHKTKHDKFETHYCTVRFPSHDRHPPISLRAPSFNHAQRGFSSALWLLHPIIFFDSLKKKKNIIRHPRQSRRVTFAHFFPRVVSLPVHFVGALRQHSVKRGAASFLSMHP